MTPACGRDRSKQDRRPFHLVICRQFSSETAVALRFQMRGFGDYSWSNAMDVVTAVLLKVLGCSPRLVCKWCNPTDTVTVTQRMWMNFCSSCDQIVKKKKKTVNVEIGG